MTRQRRIPTLVVGRHLRLRDRIACAIFGHKLKRAGYLQVHGRLVELYSCGRATRITLDEL